MKLTHYDTYRVTWDKDELIILYDKRQDTLVAININDKSSGEFDNTTTEYKIFMKAMEKYKKEESINEQRNI